MFGQSFKVLSVSINIISQPVASACSFLHSGSQA